MKKVIVGIGLVLFVSNAWAQQSSRPAKSNQIAWVKDGATAQKLAQGQKKLVMQFLMLGDLPDPNC